MTTPGNDCSRRAPSSILIVDDHPLFSDALASAIEVALGDCRIFKAETLEGAFEALQTNSHTDVVIFDLKLPDVTGISGFYALTDRAPSAKILVISSLASADLVRSLMEGGAAGFLPKDSPAATVRYALREVLAGRCYVPKSFQARCDRSDADLCAFRSNPDLANLTPQQLRILRLICDGKPNKQIAYELSLAEATVKAHITALLRRLGVQNRTQAVVMVESSMARHGGSEPEARAFLQH